MEMNFSRQLQRQLVDELRDKPLDEGEIRRVEGMGNLHVSLQREAPDGYYFRYTLAIEGTDYHFFSKNEE
jgi:hypothetical protein